MAKDNNTRYIVVAFYDGIGYTYQTDYKLHVFFCNHSAISYKRLGCAITAAESLYWKYACISMVCVFKVELGERLSCDQYKDWSKDENRTAYKAIWGE